MDWQKIIKVSGLFVIILLGAFSVNAQLNANMADFTDQTNYPAFQEIDNIYIFCVDEGVTNAQLTVTSNLEGEKTFTWQKYNELSAAFEEFASETSSGNISSIANLADGCYQVLITNGTETENYRAWVMNEWITAEAMVGESNCDYFQLNGTFETAELFYYDLQTNEPIQVLKDINVEWKQNETIIGRILTSTNYDPPTADTEYTFRVYDRFGCEVTVKTTYVSIVTKANFEMEANFNEGNTGEGPLEVTFVNTSENGSSGQYEWYIYKSIEVIAREMETTSEPIDSIDFIIYDDSPVYTFEYSGQYKIMLVSKKISDLHTCTDTLGLKPLDFIVVDTSVVNAPNAFSPNGDGVNDNFIVRFYSMKEVKISIFNRWGKKIHFWEDNDVRGFENTYDASVWDGKINGRFASPGVYFYVVEGFGRDDNKRWAKGFVHLFRDKN